MANIIGHLNKFVALTKRDLRNILSEKFYIINNLFHIILITLLMMIFFQNNNIAYNYNKVILVAILISSIYNNYNIIYNDLQDLTICYYINNKIPINIILFAKIIVYFIAFELLPFIIFCIFNYLFYWIDISFIISLLLVMLNLVILKLFLNLLYYYYEKSFFLLLLAIFPFFIPLFFLLSLNYTLSLFGISIIFGTSFCYVMQKIL